MSFWRFLLAIILLGGANFVYGAAGDVAISEILFDPAGGTDTGQEYVIIKNFGSASQNLSGWDLYPDGIGYFTFPDFILEAGKSVKINLRASGTNDASNLYFPTATGNMSNSSGSLALFSSTTHSKDTIISYIRYHKAGSTERKTWETAAASAGLWTAGTFFDISAGTEGKILKLIDYNQKTSITGWSLTNASQSDAGAEPAPVAENDIATTFSGSVAPLPVNQIKAYAGLDRAGIAGGEIFFEGFAEGIKGDPLDGARFSWNFGDGMVLVEGKKVGHTFLFPGVYMVSLNVAAGEYSALDMATVTVSDNPLIISELKPGPDGWVEIKNNSARKIEISRFGFGEGASKPFFFPENTYLAPYALVALSASTLGFVLPESGEVKLLYPNGKIIFSSNYPNLNLNSDESLSFENGKWLKTKITPGLKNEMAKPAAPLTKNAAEPKTNSLVSVAKNTESAQTASVISIEKPPSFLSGYFWLFTGLGAGIFAGLIFVIIRRNFTL
ncbi:MAG: lamin tail domain-containing protein [Candidatus Giovannonibacteria bacterium]|nr:lamin tail domain-containing protein [Candidatus Giovannonibacteria bacterium]